MERINKDVIRSDLQTPKKGGMKDTYNSAMV